MTAMDYEDKYTDRFTKPAKVGKHFDLIFGLIHEGVALGTANGTDKTFTFTPTTYGPFYPKTSYPKDFVATKDDIAVYDDGTAATVSSFDVTTGVATLSAVPTKDSVMTGDVVEQSPLYILQKATLTPKRESEKLEQVRNPTVRKTYGSTEFTLKADWKVADLLHVYKLLEATSTPGLYVYPDDPVTVYAAILVFDDDDDLEDIIYCDSCEADFKDILEIQAGKKAVTNGFELTVGVPPRFRNVALSVS